MGIPVFCYCGKIIFKNVCLCHKCVYLYAMKNTKKEKEVVITVRHMTARVDKKGFDNIQEMATKLDRSFNWVVNKILLNAKIEDIDRNS